MERPARATEQQLAGVAIEKSKIVSSRVTSPLEQRRLIKAMILAPPRAILEAERQRRNHAIDTVMTYCNVKEGDMCGGRKWSGGRPKRVAVSKENERKSRE